MPGFLRSLTVLIWLLTMMISVEVSASARLDFDQGKTQFKAGNYQKAVNYFERARRQGMKSVSLYFNLASSYYKLGDYDNAKRFFQVVSEVPRMKPLADFNLGLVAKKAGDYAAAKSYFQSVMNTSTDQKLVQLAQREFVRLAGVSRPVARTKDWLGYASISAGHDSNINIAPIGGAPTEEDDLLMDAYLTMDYLVDGHRDSGWLADAILFRRNYKDSNQYDESQIGIGVTKTQSINNWATQYQLHMDQFTYAGDDYQTIAKFQAYGRNRISRNQNYVFKYSLEKISSDNVAYDYLKGDRQKFRAEYRLYGRGDSQRYYYEYEINSREDTATRSYSPTRHGLRAVYTQYLGQSWSLDYDLAYRLSSYSDPGSSSDRDEARSRFGLNLDFRIDKTLKLRTRAIYTKNDSDDNNYDYDRTQISMNISKLF